MPIYDFYCNPCGKEFECLLLNEDEAECPVCGSYDVKKMVSLFSCTKAQLDKRLKMDSEEKIKNGIRKMKSQKFRKNRIKIL
ncbi:MAG: zinc ribbon domain-containing protein [Deltaproteobacteria bacterium]|nr:zinc ribbon domain-containing protein [Deltaproteobacteria bacterium]